MTGQAGTSVKEREPGQPLASVAVIVKVRLVVLVLVVVLLAVAGFASYRWRRPATGKVA